MNKPGRRFSWRNIHRWIGLPASVMLLVFCISGLILNHRTEFASCSVSRSILPPDYRIRNFNNGVIRGTLPLDGGRLLAYGNSGVWLTDRLFSSFTDFSRDLPAGPDNRNIRNVVKSDDGTLWCATQFGLYRHDGLKWNEIYLPGPRERLADLTTGRSGEGIVVLGRSAVYTPVRGGFRRIELLAPEGSRPQVTLFRTLWLLHSGELFGTAGRIVADFIAVVLIFLSITGILLFVLPYRLRRRLRPARWNPVGIFRWSFRWHDLTGYVTLLPDFG